MKKWVTAFTTVKGNNFYELGMRINEFLQQNSDLEDFEIVNIQYGKGEKYFKDSDPRLAHIIYRYKENKQKGKLWKLLGLKGSGEK